MKKAMVFYPAGKLYQRGEDRCQSNISASTATSARACNDLGYVSAILKQHNIEVFLKDYQSENLTNDDLIADFTAFQPDLIFISTTNATVFEDIKIVDILKSIKKEVVVVIKGAIFYDADESLLRYLNLKNVDFLVGSEVQFVFGNLLDSILGKRELTSVPSIFYKNSENIFVKTSFENHFQDVDSIPFPDRSLMNNSLYIRPDTGETQATIETSFGCPSSCVFCMTPKISGRKVRFRSVENVFTEIQECYFKYGIKNFFFKADTFTVDRDFVVSLCEKIIHSNMYRKIEWVANSRVNTVDEELLKLMKLAGCWLIAFGFESGDDYTLKLIKKRTTIAQNKSALFAAKKAGLQVYGFFLVGFPFENKASLEKTKNHIFELNPDFIELHLATPFYGTELYNMEIKENLIDGKNILGSDYFEAPVVGTKYLTINQLVDFRNSVLLGFHLRPSYILKKILYSIKRPIILMNYIKYGIRLLLNIKKR